MRPLLARLITPALVAHTSLAAFYYPTPQAAFLEHILVDNWGAHASNFSSAITPCSNYVTEVGEPAANSGRTTAAQWMRVAFHDFVTADVGAGTGGVDASIGFETERGENSGSAFNDSFTFWAPFVNDAVSMADLVGLGTVMSMRLCGGQRVPYRPGRIDALQADPTVGVPAPETDLEETLVFFERAGFNQVDSIGLTACGHTMGSVHHGGFPDVVPESAVTPNNTNSGSNFDTSRAEFDTNVVHEYIDWTGNRGGPLVTTDNITTRSDLRLYESDGNATMQELYDMGDGFLSTCVDLMGRMINTVPAGVDLGAPISPMEVKPINVTFDLDVQGSVELSGKIRALDTALPIKASLVASDGSSEPVILKPENEEGSSVYGQTRYYSFSVPVHQDTSYTTLEISRDGAAPAPFPLQNDVFVVPSMTAVEGNKVGFAVAVRATDYSPVDINVSAPARQQGTLAPKVTSHDAGARPGAVVPGYRLWEGSVDLGDASVTGAVSVSVAAEVEGGVVRDVLYLSAGVAGW
ncbi:hypothetical protein INS49_004196 [Diaporthe citri]|uniref:uncharacterized protein n=1 Tax=Diaporthe citri TaxID=83186 RepID=UPI001C8168F3|nr:uncharacterized protein INS49_004196 [Diaporthe citri]KAG6355115.1 hypothetical protein INS49_004196 [Diaporthe citri]